jgi:hypothetical protein
MSIAYVVYRARTEPICRPDFPHAFDAYACSVVDPVPWDKEEMEREFGIDIPSELVMLWDDCGGLVLYEDTTYGQAGLAILSPADAAARTREYLRDSVDDDARPGDFIIGAFCAEQRRVLIRSDKGAEDYGAIMIVAPIEERVYWRIPERSLETFLVRYMDAHGDDYWSMHYPAILADRAASKRIADVVQRALTEENYRPDYLNSFDLYTCRVVSPGVWFKGNVESEFGIVIPEDLYTLWDQCSGLFLYEEACCRQRGLVIVSPFDAVMKTRKYLQERADDAKPGDLILGEFWGDQRLVLFRCDKDADDYGAIMIVAEKDERAKWYVPERSLDAFLVHYMDARGEDYWDAHREKVPVYSPTPWRKS